MPESLSPERIPCVVSAWYRLAWILAVVAAGTTAGAQHPSSATTGRGSLAGVILRDDSTEAPIAGAEVLIAALERRAVTDSSGAFSLSALPVGAHVVEIRALGYVPLNVTLAWTGEERLVREFLLGVRAPTSLPRIEVGASRLREFEERRALGKGHFLTADVFAKHSANRVADVLARVPGLRIRRGRDGSASVINSRGNITMRGANPTCYAHVYVDDAPVFNSAAERFRSNVTAEPQGLFDVNTLTTNEIIGVEYYAGGAAVPAKYNRTGAACGVLLIWTRR